MRNEVEELGAPVCVERHGSYYFFSTAIIAVKQEVIHPSFTTRSAARTPRLKGPHSPEPSFDRVSLGLRSSC